MTSVTDEPRILKWMSYPKSLIATVFAIFWTGITAAVVIVITTVFGRGSVAYRWVQFWGRALLWAYNIRLRVEGLENLPTGGALYVFNHSSLLDIPVVHAAVPRPIKFGAKIELFKIPIFGAAMRRFGALPIVRHNRQEVFKVYQESIQRVHQGESFVLAPEGTRGSGAELKPFKSGPFIFAINGQFPMVPLVLINVSSALPRKAIFGMWGQWSIEVVVRILPPVDTTNFTLDHRPQLQELVRNQMVAAYSKVRTDFL